MFNVLYCCLCNTFVCVQTMYKSNTEVRELICCTWFRICQVILNDLFNYFFQVCFGIEQVQFSKCTCIIGQSGSCGHVTALLYQLAYYKHMKLKSIPTDVP